MLKKLQRRFLCIALFALCVIVSVQLIAVNVMNVYQRDSEVREMLYIIAENDGLFPSGNGSSGDYIDSFFNPFKKFDITIETPYSTRYFVVKLHNNVVTDISTQSIASVNDKTAFEYASQVYQNAPGYGFIGNYRYYYSKNYETGKAIMVFIDSERELIATFRLFSFSLLIGILSVLVMLVPIWLLSKKAMRPVEKSLIKQRQFITDAGHELKTPIAIISADADVLEMCEGENEWITSIKNQSVRLDGLVKELVTLSKLEEEKAKPKLEPVNLSEAATETASSFETLAKANDVSFLYNISKGVVINGNENEIRQLISILCDNAVKYTTTGGQIKLSVYKSTDGCVLEMYNDCENIEKEKLEKLFDRFYRADSSRSRETGGYGIGLSIAQVIVERNKGKISVFSEKNDSITFKVVFKKRR